ncbi:MAG: hypothetical protein JOZ39_08535 [Chloroflexi bacterium]|nr:hypothetical protein [Chloroflexota bacterium]
MWEPKACRRCGGDMYKTSTEDGIVSTCLQCGHEVLDQPRHPEMSPDELYALFHDEPVRKLAA